MPPALPPGSAAALRLANLAARQMLLLAALALVASSFGEVSAADSSDAWVKSAAALVPEGFVTGRAYRVAGVAMTAHLAAFPAGADNPATPGSAFDPGYRVAVRLGVAHGRPAFVSGTFGPRRWADVVSSPVEAYHDKLRNKLKAGARALPPGTTPCLIYAWSASDDPAGLSVHAEPLASSPVLGRLAPPYLPPESEIAPPDGWRTEFSIVGYRDGWFLIGDAREPGAHYKEAASDGQPRSYAGRGWVRTGEVGAAYANTQMPVGWLLQAPNIDARALVPVGSSAEGDRMSIDGTLKRLFACSANWALTESIDGTRGWWRGICSNQATNCS